MIYTSEFTALNGIDYKIEITTEKGTGTEKFVLGASPFTTSMDSDGKTIYAPLKTTGATIEMLTATMPFNLYSSNNFGSKVKLTNTTNNKVEWVGFVTPNAYTQGFDGEKEVIEIECADGISSLKDVPYRTSAKQIETFLNIIFKILKRCNCYRYLYVTDNVRMTSSDTSDILSKIRVSEENFFDTKDYEAQPDDDVAWDCYDVLYEIMQFMGYTLIADGEDVYVMDYDAIRNNKNNFYRYSLSGTSIPPIPSPTSVTISHRYHIDGESYSKSGSNISIGEIFNQAKVVDDFNEIDNLLEGVDKAKNFENITSITDVLTDPNEYREVLQARIRNGRGEMEPMLVMIKLVTPDARLSGGADKKGDPRYYLVIAKFYNNPLIQVKRYANSASHSVVSNSTFNPEGYSQLSKYFGAHIAGYFTKCYNQDEYNEWRAGWGGDWNTFTTEKKLELFGRLCNMGNVGSKKLDNYIVGVNLNNDYHISHDNTTSYPYFTLTKQVPTTFGGDGGYVVLSGKVRRHNNYTGIFPLDGQVYIHNDTDGTSIYKDEGYVWARMKWGNKYWKCEGSYTDKGQWVDTPANFKLFYGDPTKEVRVGDWLDKEVDIYNNCGALWGVDDKGYYFSVPDGGNLAGTIELTIFANKDTKGKYERNNAKDKKNSYKGYPPFVMMYKDLEIKLGYSDDALNDDAAKSDTVYTNDVSGYTNINPMKEIKFKICTYDNKTPSYSTVDYLLNGVSVYLDTTYNQATGMTLRQEEHFVTKNVSQYRDPRIEFECNLKGDLNIKPWSLLTDKTLNGRSYIIDKMSIDYRLNSIQMTIIEKTNQYN